MNLQKTPLIKRKFEKKANLLISTWQLLCVYSISVHLSMISMITAAPFVASIGLTFFHIFFRENICHSVTK